MIPTKIAVVTVSCRVGHTTLLPSARTWFMNSAGEVLRFFSSAIAAASVLQKLPAFRDGGFAAPVQVREGFSTIDVGRQRLSRRGKRQKQARWARCRGLDVTRWIGPASAPAEHSGEQTRLVHRQHRAMLHVAQAGIAVGARRDPVIGAAAAESHAGHDVPPVKGIAPLIDRKARFVLRQAERSCWRGDRLFSFRKARLNRMANFAQCAHDKKVAHGPGD